MEDEAWPGDLADLDGELEGEPPPGFLEELEGEPPPAFDGEVERRKSKPTKKVKPKPKEKAPEEPSQPKEIVEKPLPKPEVIPEDKPKPAPAKKTPPVEAPPPPQPEESVEPAPPPAPESPPEVIGKPKPKAQKKIKPKPSAPEAKQAPAPAPVAPPAPAPAEPAPSPSPPEPPKPPPVAPPVAPGGPAAPGYSEIVFDDEKPPPRRNYEVRHHSKGAGVALNSIYLCYASPFFISLFVILLGWNEKRAVCDSYMISKGKELVVEVGCDSSADNDGKLVMMSCSVKTQGLTQRLGGDSVFADGNYTGACLNTQSQMYQCVEHQTQTKVKVGERTGTKTTYTYVKEWKSSREDSSKFNAKARKEPAFLGCSNDSSFQNPPWPKDVPSSALVRAESVQFGSFQATGPFIPIIECKTPTTSFPTPTNWTVATDDWYYRAVAGESNDTLHIGYKRVRFETNAWSENQTLYTVVGKNEGGKLVKWTAPGSWLCAGSTMDTTILKGSISKDKWFDDLESANVALTWFGRCMFFLLLWLSMCCLFGPLEVVADMVPYIGKYLGNVVEKLIIIVTCPPASCLCIGVCAIVWIAMRPAAMVPLLILFIGSAVGFVVFGKLARDRRKKDCAESQQLNP